EGAGEVGVAQHGVDGGVGHGLQHPVEGDGGAVGELAAAAQQVRGGGGGQAQQGGQVDQDRHRRADPVLAGGVGGPAAHQRPQGDGPTTAGGVAVVGAERAGAEPPVDLGGHQVLQLGAGQGVQ